MSDELNLNNNLNDDDEDGENKGAFINNLKSKFKTEKQWHLFVKIAMFAGLFVVVSVAVLIFMYNRPTMLPVKKGPVASIINVNKLSKQSWVSKAESQLQENNSQLKKIKEENKRLKKEMHDVAVIKSTNGAGAVPPGGAKPSGGIFTPPVPFQNNNNNNRMVAGPSAPVKKPQVSIIPITNPINTILNSAPRHKKRKKKRIGGFYVPAGAFTQGTLLNGLDAPASMKGKSNPYPTLIRLTNLSFLPNQYRLSMKGCFVLAEGYGSLSSERVYLRTVTLSCIVKGGNRHISVPIHGYIVGQHGKVGLRGKVVTKQGAILAREFMAGLLQGFGNIVSEQSMTMSYSALGSTSNINPSNVGEAGLGQGLASASTELSKFYAKMADSMMPVVVVGAGRKLTLVLTHGFYAEFKKNIEYNKPNTSNKGGKKK
ncbi:MAG: TraB/VirB10 family protein [bacterium]